MARQLTKDDAKIAGFLAEYWLDPLGFVMAAFPWGEKGSPLELPPFNKPFKWQMRYLDELGKQLRKLEKEEIEGGKLISKIIKKAVPSGKGAGKTALVSWLIWWAISTMMDSIGRVTAGTVPQLEDTLWKEVAKWKQLFIGKDLFEQTTERIFSVLENHKLTWRIDAMAANENNPDAFQGLHNSKKRILFVFDEASGIARSIWDRVSDTTDIGTQIIWLCFGNMTVDNGAFYDACFGVDSHKWNPTRIDTRTVENANWEKINELLERGEDSNAFRVGVRGLPPLGSDEQFISRDLVEKSIQVVIREEQIKSQPKIIGVDPSWTGADPFSIYFRQGLYSKFLLEVNKNDDDMQMAQRIAVFEDELAADAVFIDAGKGTGIYSCGKSLGRSWILVNFANLPSKPIFLNKRVEMWWDMREWLKEGGFIDPLDKVIQNELVQPECYINQAGKYQLESKDSMKRRGVKSPNRADALALTFAYPVITKNRERIFNIQPAVLYNPIAGITERWAKNGYGIHQRY